jgi:hypothetical protein
MDKEIENMAISYVHDTKQKNPTNVGSCWVCGMNGNLLEHLEGFLEVIKDILKN